MLERGGGELGQSRQHVLQMVLRGGLEWRACMHGLIWDIIRFHFETKIYTFSLPTMSTSGRMWLTRDVVFAAERVPFGQWPQDIMHTVQLHIPKQPSQHRKRDRNFRKKFRTTDSATADTKQSNIRPFSSTTPLVGRTTRVATVEMTTNNADTPNSNNNHNNHNHNNNNHNNNNNTNTNNQQQQQQF